MQAYRWSLVGIREGAMARGRVSTQRELFGTTEPAASLPPEVARQLLPLLEQLLLEAIMAEAAATEGSDEQDHA
jgi:hypothetical protein